MAVRTCFTAVFTLVFLARLRSRRASLCFARLIADL
jgi:hypothetical protein